jgi:hypothetical protein
VVTFPGVEIKPAAGVLVFVQRLPEPQRNRAVFERMLTSETAAQMIAHDLHTKPQQMRLSTVHCSAYPALRQCL